MQFRIGRGTDIHLLVPGRKLFLGGVEIPHERGLLGHSDGDVLLHAVADAILGARGMDDIGAHFPNNDARWKDVRSTELLRRVWENAGAGGWRINNLDCDVLAEAPRLRDHIKAMRESIAAILSTEAGNISVKAGTREGLDAIGEGRAIMAEAVIILARD